MEEFVSVEAHYEALGRLEEAREVQADMRSELENMKAAAQAELGAQVEVQVELQTLRAQLQAKGKELGVSSGRLEEARDVQAALRRELEQMRMTMQAYERKRHTVHAIEYQQKLRMGGVGARALRRIFAATMRGVLGMVVEVWRSNKGPRNESILSLARCDCRAVWLSCALPPYLIRPSQVFPGPSQRISLRWSPEERADSPAVG